MSDYPEARLDALDIDAREGERRSEQRCLCGHGPLWHMGDGRCLGMQSACACLEFVLQPDRRDDNEAHRD